MRLAVEAAMAEKPRGGHGGSVTVFGSSGKAIGGRGGRGGDEGFGRGGDGGGGDHSHGGTSIGGDGGDAGRLGRPALGAASTLERESEFKDSISWKISLATSVDEYGIMWPGRGGDSYEAQILFNERIYSLNVILRLIRIWESHVIDCIDLMGPENEQEWWNLAERHFPQLCERVIAHMRACEDNPEQSPPSPY